MLWDAVFEFFVMYVFGGVTSNGTFYSGTLGRGYSPTGVWETLTTTRANSGISILINSVEYKLPLGNYLSMIATIISMVVIVVLCCKLIKQIYNICAHVIG